MSTRRLLCAAALIGAAAIPSTGCMAHAHTAAYVEAGPPVFYEPPTLVEIDSGVWIVQNCDYAVYYVDGAYWVYREDVWYRSDRYDGGWVAVHVDIVPTVVVHRYHRTYVHYRGAVGARTRIGPREPEMRPAALERRSPPPEPAPPRPRMSPEHRAAPPRHAPSRPFLAPPGHTLEPRHAPPERSIAPTHRAAPQRTFEPNRMPSERRIAPPSTPAPGRRDAPWKSKKNEQRR